MRILGVIPARGGSKSVPKKNIKMLAGRPLIAWSIEVANQSKLTRVILSTDSEEIADIGRHEGADVPFIRPSYLATDTANAVPVMQHAIKECEKSDGKYDFVMMLQPTSPMRLTKDIDCAINYLSEHSVVDSVITLTTASEYPQRMKYLDEEGMIEHPPFCEAYENQPRQELRPIYQKNGSIYLTRRDVLMNQNSFLGSKSYGLFITEKRSANIDTMFDFEIADLIMKNFEWRKW